MESDPVIELLHAAYEELRRLEPLLQQNPVYRRVAVAVLGQQVLLVLLQAGAGDPGQVVGQAEVGQQQLELRFALADGLVGRDGFAPGDPRLDPGFGCDDFAGVRDECRVGWAMQFEEVGNRGAEFAGETNHAFLFVELVDQRKRGRFCEAVKLSEPLLDGSIQRHADLALSFGRAEASTGGVDDHVEHDIDLSPPVVRLLLAIGCRKFLADVPAVFGYEVMHGRPDDGPNR